MIAQAVILRVPPEQTIAMEVEIVRVCAWCPPEVRRLQECAAAGRGLEISHVICPTCVEREFGIRKGTR